MLTTQASTVCCDMLTLMAHSKVERSYCHSDSEWMSYFLYIAERKGLPISDLQLERPVHEDEEQDEAIVAEAKAALQAEGEHRADAFDKMSLEGLPMYSVQELLDARAALDNFSPEERENAYSYELTEVANSETLPHDEQEKRAKARRDNNPALDAVLTHHEICEDARQLNLVLRFERTGHGEQKDRFMQTQRAARGEHFGEYDLKLLCTRLLMAKIFPGADITHSFVKRFEKHKMAVVNQIRLKKVGGLVSVASAADFFLRTRDSDRIDTMQHKYLIAKEAEKVVLCLGFTGLQDFDTAVPESSLTVQKVEKEMHVLHLLGVSAAKIKPAAGKQTQTNKKQLKDKTKIAKALSAAVGLTLQAKRASGGKRRRSQGAESSYVLAVARPVQEIMDSLASSWLSTGTEENTDRSLPIWTDCTLAKRR
jgi:hypothetical protein